MEQKGKLVVISGFSGAGKGTLMKALLAAHPDRYALSVSATTRDPRPGEKDGVDYFALSAFLEELSDAVPAAVLVVSLFFAVSVVLPELSVAFAPLG